MTFDGSPLTLSGGSFESTVNLINAAENTTTLSGEGGYFSYSSKLVNYGTINWTEGTWEFELSTIDNSGIINITAWNGAAIQPGAEGGSTFNNLNGGTINVNGQVSGTIGVKDFANAGTLNFTGGSTTTFKVNDFTQIAGTISISGNSEVDVQIEDGTDGSGTMKINGGTVGGYGTIKGILQVGQATIRPGTTTIAGVLNIAGNLTMGAQTQTSMLIAGNNTNSQLAVTGTVTLGGNLTVAIANGVNVDANQSWTIITGSRQGQFAAPPAQPAGFSAPTYNPQSVDVQNPEMRTCGPQVIIEDTVLVFSNANNNAISIPAPDAGAAILQVAMTITNGTMSLATISGLTFTTGTGSGDTSMTFTGTIDAINAALDGLTYIPTPNVNGSAWLAITTTDTLESGGSFSETHVVPITITPINDAPSGADTTITIYENTTYSFKPGDFGFTDPADGNAFLAVLVQPLLLGSAGTLRYDGVEVTANLVVLVENLHLLTYTPPEDVIGDALAAFFFKVEDDGGGDNDFDTDWRTLTIDVDEKLIMG